MEYLSKQQIAVESIEKLRSYSNIIGNTPENFFQRMQGNYQTELSLVLEAIEIAINHSDTIIEALEIGDGLKLREMELKDGKLDVSLQGEVARVYMECFINLFEQNGGKNFLTVTMTGQGKKYGITIQDCTKELTPAEKLEKMEKEFLETLARNIAAWQTSKDKKEGLLPEVYLHDTYLFKKMTDLSPDVWKNLKKYAPGLSDKGKW